MFLVGNVNSLYCRIIDVLIEAFNMNIPNVRVTAKATVAILFILLFYGASYAQSNRAKTSNSSSGFGIEMTSPAFNKHISVAGENSIMDYLDYTRTDAPGAFKLPYDELIIAIPPHTKPSITLQILEKNTIKNAIPSCNPAVEITADSVVKYKEVPVTSASLKTSREQLEVKGYFWYRDFYCVHVRVRLADYSYSNNSIDEISKYKLIVNTGGAVQATAPIIIHSDMDRVVSEMITNSANAEQFRSIPSFRTTDTTGSWFSTAAQYLKIGTYQDKLYRITKQTLDKAGISSSGIDPLTFRMFQNGVEVPITVYAQTSGTFGVNDYIEFYGHKNYETVSDRSVNPDSLPYNNYLNMYSDTLYYFLTWGGIQGLRTSVKDATPIVSTDTLKYYTDFIHYEPNTVFQEIENDVTLSQDPTKLNRKSWFADFVFSSYNFNVTLTNLVQGKTAGVYCRVSSAGSNYTKNAHTVAVGFRKFPSVSSDTIMYIAGSQTFDKGGRAVVGGNISTDSLTSGVNSIRIRNYENGSSVNYLVYDWYEVEYPRSLLAQNDSLVFAIRDSLAYNLRNIKITNVSSTTDSLVLYRIAPTYAKLQGFIKDGTNLVFSDSVGGGSMYCLSAVKRITQPLLFKSKIFVGLRSSRKADYIGITHSSLINAAKSYMSFINSNYSVDTALVNVEDIFDEFAYGNPEPAAIRAFLKATFQYWQSPKPSYVCLLGTGSYDYKGYWASSHSYFTGLNLVPTFGEPVSDTWYTMWNDNAPYIQQMLIGRIPAKSESQLNYYLQKHQNYLNQRYDLWNKRALFFSGGDSADSLQLSETKSVNDYIIQNYTHTSRLALVVDHFYKVYSPASNFGPYSASYIRNSIEQGGIFISYIGHSGTRTWDNSIADPNQLLNSSNKSSLVTDFGCSTAKFAEPDVDSFGGLFVNEGQTIAYIGNTSLGFSSTTLSLPQFFYGKVLQDSITRISSAHFAAKQKMFNELGSTGSYRIFALTNTLLGDPIVNLALPTKPNLAIASSDIALLNQSPTEQDDSITVKIHYSNLGLSTSDSVSIKVTHSYTRGAVDTSVVKRYRVKVPDYADSLSFKLLTLSTAGQHTLKVQLDSDNTLDEMYEDDNEQSVTFYVSSLSLKLMGKEYYDAQITPSASMLNAAATINKTVPQIIVQYDTTLNFLAPVQFTVPSDTFFTKLTFGSLQSGKRYWARFRSSQNDTSWGETFSLYKAAQNASMYLEDSTSFTGVEKSGVVFKSGMRLSIDSVHIVIKSGGGYYTKYGSINDNEADLLPNSTGWGMGIAVIDPVTLKADTAANFNYGGGITDIVVKLSQFIQAIPNGKIVAMCVIDDGNLSGANKDTLVKAIKTIGGSKVSSIGFRTPWLIFGKKGAASGTVPEKLETPYYQGLLTFDTLLTKNNSYGTFTTQTISNTKKLRTLTLNSQVPSGATVKIRPVITTKGGNIDSLSYLTLSASPIDLTSMAMDTIKSVKFVTELYMAADGSSPVINSEAVQFDGIAELGMNYQSVTLSQDTVTNADTLTFGKQAYITATVSNAGDISSDSVKVTIVEKPSNTLLDSRILPPIPTESRVTYQIPYTLSSGDAQRQLLFTVDADNRTAEFSESNNVYSFPFIVSADSGNKPFLQVYSDDKQIYDGDFVTSTPRIRIELTDPSYETIDTNYIKNTETFKILLDNAEIPYNDSRITYTFQDVNPRMTALFVPVLTDGSHTIKVIAIIPSLSDTLTFKKTVNVNQNLQLLDVFNYPNPFSHKTNFTFVLSTVPEELTIRIYAVSGRLLKVIRRSADDLTVGFNKSIEWDGRDEDGDLVANGVYLYKVILKKDGKSETNTNKLAIVR
jgi:hypothetical protein